MTAYVIDVLTLIAVMTIAVHGYMLIKGLGGLLHFGHPVFYGLGAYTSAILTTTVLPNGTFLVSLICAVLVAAGGAVIIGWPALRDRGRYFLIVTFAVQLMFVTLVINFDFTGGPDGISSIPRMSFGAWQLTSKSFLELGFLTMTVDEINLVLITFFAAVSFWFCHRIIRSPYGRLVRATRDDELAVEAYGRRPVAVKLSIFAIGAGVTGAAGSILAHYFNYIGPFQFELNLLILFLMMLVLGGQGSLVGATVGTALMVVLLEVLRYLLEDVFSVPFEVTAHMREVVFSVTLILVLFVRPDGLFPEKFQQYKRITGGDGKSTAVERAHVDDGPRLKTHHGAQTISDHENPKSVDAVGAKPVIRSEGLTKFFGGLRAVDKCDLQLREKSIVSIIGPNGAGKTTVFNMISGFVQPDEGQVFLGDVNITGEDPATIAKRGVARTFQDVRIWPRLTVIENVLVTVQDQVGENPLRLFVNPGPGNAVEAKNIDYAWSLLERYGLQDKANQLADEISYAQKKMLALARLTAFKPDTMLLDEPTAGVDLLRLDTFLDHIRSFVERDQCSVCLIEHNMDVVRELADWVFFMEEGKVIAEGPPEDVLGDRDLMSIYLGRSTAVAV